MAGNLKEEFIARLEERYGPLERQTSKFGSSPFGVIADDLSISASQFTKLLSGTATEGMYVRSIENIHRLLKFDQVMRERDHLLESNEQYLNDLDKFRRQGRKALTVKVGIGLIALALGAAAALWLFGQQENSNIEPLLTQHPLAAFFDTEFGVDADSPYLDPSEAQEYCPCSAFEGVWELEEEYKLPLPGTGRPGVYYVAKSADVRMKCSRSNTANLGKGRVLLGYEYLINEIWIDTESTPFSPKYFDKDKLQFTEEFEGLDFEAEPNFKRVAVIHSFFIDRFELYPDSVVRNGEPCGRFATDVDPELAQRYRIDPEHILEDVVGNLTTTACQSSPHAYCDPNDLRENESTISFACLYTIKSENLGIGGGYPYTKGYKLIKQNYADNLMCSCMD